MAFFVFASSKKRKILLSSGFLRYGLTNHMNVIKTDIFSHERQFSTIAFQTLSNIIFLLSITNLSRD